MDKPPALFDRDREWRALDRFVNGGAPGLTLGIVSGRRRQGKTFLLQALARATGAFYFAAEEATERESLAQFGKALAHYLRTPGTFDFSSWKEAFDQVFEHCGGRLVIIDEFPYLLNASPSLPSVIQHQVDSREQPWSEGGPTRLILCGSAMSVMGGLLSGNAPLRGRASLELIVRPFDFKTAARFWEADSPRLAALLHAITGGTPAYRTRYVDHRAPASLEDFDRWVVERVLDNQSPLYREARHLIASEGGIRDASLYHAVLGAIAAGRHTRSGIAEHCGRQASDLTHALSVLEDCDLIRVDPDAFKANRHLFRINEPLIVFYEAIMRPAWSRLELGQADAVWRESASKFTSQVMGPHFEQLCRTYTMAGDRFGGFPSEVSSGVITDKTARSPIEVDVVATSALEANRPKRVLCLGEVKWGTRMDMHHLARLARVRDLLAKKQDTADTALACFSAAGFSDDLAAAASGDPRIHLIELDDLYR
ncbi:ATP-binding protein [Glycomyces sp. A-F 0318]|uniref:AAA family ATPase n=1 Tax=Glycomyces amatae TaxID=2881355 RepID=UPI001E484DD9|nr:ATP-binding protein [Glycomyces amatae]MCD0443706.1 ATP-binding protein [Glycomyces amatae]